MLCRNRPVGRYWVGLPLALAACSATAANWEIGPRVQAGYRYNDNYHLEQPGGEVEVSVRDGVMSARLEAETASARNVLLDNLPALRERLAEQNIKVERFDVDVRDEQRQAPGEQFAGQPDVPRQGQRDRPRGQEIKRLGAVALGAPRGAFRGDNAGELNIVI